MKQRDYQYLWCTRFAHAVKTSIYYGTLVIKSIFLLPVKSWIKWVSDFGFLLLNFSVENTIELPETTHQSAKSSYCNLSRKYQFHPDFEQCSHSNSTTIALLSVMKFHHWFVAVACYATGFVHESITYHYANNSDFFFNKSSINDQYINIPISGGC
jgi:hypothetical protein